MNFSAIFPGQHSKSAYKLVPSRTGTQSIRLGRLSRGFSTPNKSISRVSPGHGRSVSQGQLRLRAATADAASEPHSKEPDELFRLGRVSVTASEGNRLWLPALAAYFLRANLDGKGMLLVAYKTAELAAAFGLALFICCAAVGIVREMFKAKGAGELSRVWTVPSLTVAIWSMWVASTSFWRDYGPRQVPIQLQYPLLKGTMQVHAAWQAFVAHHAGFCAATGKAVLLGGHLLLAVAVWKMLRRAHARAQPRKAQASSPVAGPLQAPPGTTPASPAARAPDGQLTALQDELAQLRTRVSVLQASQDKADRNITSLSQGSADREDIIKSRLVSLEGLTATEAQQLKSRLKALEERPPSHLPLLERLSALEERTRKDQEENGKDGKKDKAAAELSKRLAAVEQWVKYHKEKEEEESSEEDAYEQLEGRVDDLKWTINQVAGRLEDMQADKEKQDSKQKDMERDMEELEWQMVACQERLVDLENDKEEEDEESGKEEDDSDKEGDNSDAKGDPEFNDRVARLKKSMAEYHKGMAMLQEQMAEFKMLLQGLGKGFGQGFGQDGLAEARAAIQGLQARLDNTACIKGSRALEAHLSALWRAVDAQVSCTDKLQAAEHHFDAHWGQAKVDLAAAKAELPELAAKVQGVQEQLPGMLAELKALRGDLGGAPALEWEEVQRKVGEAVAREVQRAERRAAQQLARSEEGVRAELADLARQLAAPGAARAESRAAQLANREDDVRRELEDLARQLAAAEARAAEARGKALNIVGASGVNYSCSGAADLRARHEEAVVGHLRGIVRERHELLREFAESKAEQETAEVEQSAMGAAEVATEVPEDSKLPGLPELVRPNQPTSMSGGEDAEVAPAADGAAPAREPVTPEKMQALKRTLDTSLASAADPKERFMGAAVRAQDASDAPQQSLDQWIQRSVEADTAPIGAVTEEQALRVAKVAEALQEENKRLDQERAKEMTEELGQEEPEDSAVGAGHPADMSTVADAEDNSSFTVAVEAEAADGGNEPAKVDKGSDTTRTCAAAQTPPAQDSQIAVEIEWVEVLGVAGEDGEEGEAQSKEPRAQVDTSDGAAAEGPAPEPDEVVEEQPGADAADQQEAAAEEAAEEFEVVEKAPAGEPAGRLGPAVEDFVGATAWLAGFEQELLAARQPNQAPPEPAAPTSGDAAPSSSMVGPGKEAGEQDAFWVPVESWGAKKKGSRAPAPSAEKLIPVDVVDGED